MPKGVYVHTKPIWNKGLSALMDPRVRANTEHAATTKASRVYVGWNKDITCLEGCLCGKHKPFTVERRARISKSLTGKSCPLGRRERIRATLTGRKYSPDHGQKISKALTGKPKPQGFGQRVSQARRAGFRDGTIKVSPLSGYGKGGYRVDLGHFCRSRFEANYCRFLNLIGVEYQYEPKRFVLVLPDGMERTYAPDLYLPSLNLWRELKGYMSTKGADKIEAFRKQYPTEQLDVVFEQKGNWPKMISSLKKEIPSWE